jgi:rubrerythrin
MSVPEVKPPEKSKADERVEIILARIDALKKEMDQFKPPVKTETPSKTKEEDPYDHVHTCPTCKAKLDKEISDRAREETDKAFKERAKYPLQCEGCGLGVKIEEASCPGCGSKQARERRY